MKKWTVLLFALLMLALCITPAFASEAPDTEEVVDVLLSSSADAPAETTELTFEPGNFVDNLSYMGVGMLGIFIVIGIIILATVVLNRIFSGKAGKNE